ncbi:hypothetical protein EG834_00670 [bacterium]|nr:hypothetical protein [bacterium]
MKLCMKLYLLILVNLVMAGCMIGNGHICGPQTPLAYCDKEAYEKLLHPKPYLDYWEKPGMTVEGRSEDSFRCGGSRGGDDPPESKINEIMRLHNESYWQANERIQIEWRNCMKAKGYQYVNSQK